MNLANKITLLRACLLPLIWLFWVLNETYVLLFLLLVNIVGDILDGYVARKLKQETSFGAKFDGFVDGAYYLSVLIWSLYLLSGFKLGLILITLATFPSLIALIRFKKMIVIHLWSSKLTAAILFLSFVMGNLIPTIIEEVFLVSLMVIIINTLERSLILLLRKEIPDNLPTIFHLYQKDKPERG